MLKDLDVFLSEHDLGSGERWAMRLAEQLGNTSFGIICLTTGNQAAPWLLFEAGALAKHVDGRVCGILLNGLRAADVVGPLAQFQHTEWVKDGLLKLLRDINSKLTTPADSTQLDRIFETWWPQIEQGYAQATATSRQPSRATAAKRTDSEILQEILERTRAIERSAVARPAERLSPTEVEMNQARLFILRQLKALPENQRGLLTAIAAAKYAQKLELAQELALAADPEIVQELVKRDLLTVGPDGRYLMNRVLIRIAASESGKGLEQSAQG